MARIDFENDGRTLHIAMLSIHSSPLGPLGTRDTGGMSVYVRELAKWLGRKGHLVDIFTSAAGDACEAILYPNVRLIHLANQGSRHMDKEQLADHLPQVFSTLDGYRRAHNLEYDLIHSHYWLSGVVGAMASRLWQCPHLVMFHTLGMAKNNTAAGENESQRRIAQERWLAGTADHILVPTPAEQDNLVRQYQADPVRLSIIPCGVDPDLFRPMDRLAVRRDLGLSPGAPLVLFVGRFAPLKGIDRLLEAISQLQSEFPGLRLMVIGGDGPQTGDFARLKGRARELGIDHAVSFLGRVKQQDLPPYYNAADLLALPSHYESFGLVVLEALACGLPVAATPVGAVTSIVREEFNGALMNSPRAQDVAGAIARILARPLTSRPTTQQIRATVLHYHWQHIAEAVAQVYAALLKNDGGMQAGDISASRSTLSKS